MALGDYTKTAYANGTTPAINATNLNNNEDKTQEIDDSIEDGSLLDVKAMRKRMLVNQFLFSI